MSKGRKFHHLKHFYKIVFLLIVPIGTIIITTVSFYDSSNFLVLKVMPVFLIIWDAALLNCLPGVFY